MRKKIVLFFLILTGALNAQNKEIQSSVTAFLENETLKHCQWGAYAEYADNGEVILDNRSEEVLAPASGLKLVTTAAAMEILGPDYRWKTRLYYDGKISNGVLDGSIYIVGGGDPTLGSDLLESSTGLPELMKEWTDAVKAAGIKEVKGSVYADDLLFDGGTIPGSWNWTDMGNYYGAQASALSIHDNLYYLYFEPGNRVGSLTDVLRTEPEIKGITFDNRVTTGPEGSGDNGYIYAAPGQFNAVLRGTIPAGVKEFSIKGSIPDPGLFAAQHFSSSLENAGVKVKGAAQKVKTRPDYGKYSLIVEKASPTLKEVAYIINKISFNLYAEQLLKTIAFEKTGSSKTGKGVEEVKRLLEEKGVNTSGLLLYDGCGLSRSNAISPKIMSRMLKAMHNSVNFEDYFWTMAVIGDPDDRGYFGKWCLGTNAEKNARVKSGSIDRVRSHSGYVKDKNGRMIVFSFIANNYTGGSSLFNNFHEELISKLSELD